MELFTYLMAKNDHNTSVKKDLFSYLLGKNQSGTYTDYSGTSLSINNTKKAKMKVNLLGNTSQTGTPTPDNPIPVNVVSGDNEVVVSGKNLFDYSKFINNGGATSTREPNKITVVNANGGENKFAFFLLGKEELLGKTITIHSNMTGTTGGIRLYFGGSTNNIVSGISGIYSPSDSKWTLTIANSFPSNCDRVLIMFYSNFSEASAGTTMVFDNTQVELGSSVSSYEPYQSQTYPINLGVENLWNTSKLKDGFVPGSGTYPINNTNFPNAKYLLVYLYKGQSLTIANQADTSKRGRIRYIDKDTNLVVDNVRATTNDYYISNFDGADGFKNGTITAKKDFIVAFMTIDITDTKVNADVTYGTTPQTISETPIELCKIGDYQDGFFKAVNGDDTYDNLDSATKETLDYGDWYLEKHIGKIVLNGSESYTNATAYYYILFSQITPRPRPSSSLFSNYFINTEENGNGGIWAGTGALAFNKNGLPSTITDLATFKTWLGNNNTTIYYQMTTPTYTKIEGTLKDELDAVWRASSYKGQTNISQINNDLPFELNVSVKVGN